MATAQMLPSNAGRRVLINIHRGENPESGITNPAVVLDSLRTRGLLDLSNKLTEAGRAMVVRLTQKPEVRRGS